MAMVFSGGSRGSHVAVLLLPLLLVVPSRVGLLANEGHRRWLNGAAEQCPCNPDKSECECKRWIVRWLNPGAKDSWGICSGESRRAVEAERDLLRRAAELSEWPSAKRLWSTPSEPYCAGCRPPASDEGVAPAHAEIVRAARTMLAEWRGRTTAGIRAYLRGSPDPNKVGSATREYLRALLDVKQRFSMLEDQLEAATGEPLNRPPLAFDLLAETTTQSITALESLDRQAASADPAFLPTKADLAKERVTARWTGPDTFTFTIADSMTDWTAIVEGIEYVGAIYASALRGYPPSWEGKLRNVTSSRLRITLRFQYHWQVPKGEFNEECKDLGPGESWGDDAFIGDRILADPGTTVSARVEVLAPPPDPAESGPRPRLY